MNLPDLLEDIAILPVITIDDAAAAVPLAEALLEGGLPALEITLRTPAARGALAAISQAIQQQNLPITLAAGTVRQASDLDGLADLGIDFAVSPGWSADLVKHAQDRNIAILPGIATAGEAMAALAAGLEVVKFFPAETIGGRAGLKALAGPFPELSFCPTGGINRDNAADYLALGNVRAVGGSWMAPAALIAEHNWPEISRRAKAARALIA